MWIHVPVTLFTLIYKYTQKNVTLTVGYIALCFMLHVKGSFEVCQLGGGIDEIFLTVQYITPNVCLLQQSPRPFELKKTKNQIKPDDCLHIVSIKNYWKILHETDYGNTKMRQVNCLHILLK